MPAKKDNTPGSASKNDTLKYKSPAEFFSENKNIAGFDNAGKSLFTTIRELVENGLDAAEAAQALPEIEMTISELSKAAYNKLIHLNPNDVRIDMGLYDDGEQTKKKQKKPKQDVKKVATDPAVDGAEDVKGKEKEPEKEKEKEKEKEVSKKDTMYYKVCVKDNGTGMAHDDIPNMLGRVLSGTKYGLKQTRGRFGLGSKMALIWSKMTTGLPIEVRSARKNQPFITYCKLDIDIRKNVPNILIHEKLENSDKWRGTDMSVTVEGNWTTYKARIMSYMRMMAIITPYAHFDFRFNSEAADKSFNIRYARRTDQMPPLPREVKHHPSSVHLLLLKQLIGDTRHESLEKYLCNEFSSIDKPLALRLITEMGEDFTPQMKVKEMSDKQIVRMSQLLKVAKFDPPDGSCLSPAGEYNLRLGIIKQLQPDLVATYQVPVRVFEGHPFIVEAGVCLGGVLAKPGIAVFRFANRIPLLFEPGADVVTRTANHINWVQYKIRQKEDKIGVFVSIVSTKIPFKGTGKEYIGDDIEEIKDAVKKAITQCCLQLKVKLTKRAALIDRQQRKKNLAKYVPDAARAVFGLLNQLADEQGEPESKRRKITHLGTEGEELVKQVRAGQVTEATLNTKLAQHIEQIDSEQALEYVMATGLEEGSRQDFYLTPCSFDRKYSTEFVSTCCLLRLLSQ